MSESPVLVTSRLRLVPVKPRHAPAIQAALADREIADTMISIPYPYPAGEAARYVAHQARGRERGQIAAFAIEMAASRRLLGVVEIRDIDREHEIAELSYWLARAFWGQGYVSEAVAAVLGHAFDTLGLNRVYAFHMQRNPASARVLEKSGFRREGLMRQRIRKWGVYEDVAMWGMLHSDWDAAPGRC